MGGLYFHVPNSAIGGIDSNTKLILHGDESPLVDSSLSPKSLTLNNGIARSATESKFGGYSINFDGTNQYISLADSTDWDFGTGDFTIDFWMKTAGVYNTDRGAVIDCFNGTAGWYVHVYESGANKLGIYLHPTWFGVTTGDYIDDQWHHIAIVVEASTLKVYRDGVSQTLTSDTVGSVSGSTDDLRIGLGYAGAGFGTSYFKDYLDEFRISKGIARWTSNFTPESGPYTTTT